MITRFIADHQGHRDGPDGLRWGVEPICARLTELGVPIAPSTYYDQVNRQPSRRQCRDDELTEHIKRVHAANYGVYGRRRSHWRRDIGIGPGHCHGAVRQLPPRPSRSRNEPVSD